MKTGSRFILPMLALLLILAGCGGSAEQTDGKNAEADSISSVDTVDVALGGEDSVAVNVINVKTLVVQPEVFDDVISVVGTIKADEDINVASEEGGKVERWFVSKGAYVKKGQVLLQLNDDILQAQLAAAKAQEKIARLNAEKNAQVYADAGAVSEVTVTTAQYNLDAASANVRLLETRINKMRVRAPVGGRIDARLIDIGEMVGPGSPVARLLQTGVVDVAAGVPERYVKDIRVGLPVEITFDGLAGRKVPGRITYVGTTINQSDRTVPIEVALSNGGEFKPEMIAEINIVRDRLRNVIVIPRTGLIRVEDGYQVYVAVEDGKGGYIVETRPVVVGPSDRGTIVITSGLKVGDRVIVVGQNKVNPGEQVELATEE